MTRRSFDPTWHGDSTLRDSSIVANTAGERHDAAVTACDQETRHLHGRDDTLTVLQALGLIAYDDQPALTRYTGPRGHNAKVSAEQLTEMVTLRAGGAMYHDIAAQYGLTASHVGKLIRARRAA